MSAAVIGLLVVGALYFIRGWAHAKEVEALIDQLKDEKDRFSMYREMMGGDKAEEPDPLPKMTWPKSNQIKSGTGAQPVWIYNGPPATEKEMLTPLWNQMIAGKGPPVK